MEPIVAPYGAWKSPITVDLVTSNVRRFGDVVVDGQNTYWMEQQEDRNVIMSHDGSSIQMITPEPYSIGTGVHDYGGGDFVVVDGTIYFSNFSDQRLYRQVAGGTPEPITPEANKRYADFAVDQPHNRLICVCEDHSDVGEAVNSIVSVSRNGVSIETLVKGNDFYSNPRMSPDGNYLSWITWSHPRMPWDGCELWLGELSPEGFFVWVERVAGGPNESVFQPEWSPEGVLHFISDRTGWWNLYRLRDGQIEALCDMAAEFGVPQWLLNSSTYGFASAHRIICWYKDKEKGQRLASLNTNTGELTPIETPYSTMGDLRVTSERVVLKGASATEPVMIAQLDLTSGTFKVLRRSRSVGVDATYVSIPQEIEYPTGQGRTAYAYYYAPRNDHYSAPGGELPPLLVNVHGGPTASASAAFNLQIQFWTSRGFAVLDVNYGGSSGYGREYRERLRGQWGIIDVEDCIQGAEYLVQRGLVDPNRMAIRGGSAGGFTTLCALTFHHIFNAGAIYYGVSDLEGLLEGTHKFEARYPFSLVGDYPEHRDRYHARSPLYHVDKLFTPTIFFQGLQDAVVPPDQTEKMVAVLHEKHLPVAYISFEGEGHGFRLPQNIARALAAELYFYSRILGFEMAEPLEPVQIDNLNL